MATPLQVLQSDTYQQALLGEDQIPVAWFRDVYEALEQVLSARAHLESVATAARALVAAANVTHWEDLGDEIRGLALACDELDGPQPIPDKGDE